MNVRTVVGLIAALVLSSSAFGLSQEQIKQGCVDEGRTISCPNQMKSVEVAPIQKVEVAPINRVEVAPIKRHRPAKQAQNSNIAAEAQQRGKVIDPKGQGMNQAQIDAMEKQRQLMWNTTHPEMGYR
jgi:Na+-transporting NADH:ubiquinone oxidoreductase subunit NqrC